MENYQIIRQIGKGSFGRVYLVKHKIERKQYCLKSIKLEGIPASERKACQTEVKLLGSMMHPNIVGFKESFIARGGKLLCIVMTYCDGGDLAERLKQNGKRLFKEDQVLHWFVQLALGLHFMHEMNDKCVLHRDLKTQNIFLLGNGRLVIGDLGISKALDESTDFTKTTIGTPYYMSPELYKSRPYNHKADVWALGCVLYEMATLRHAFNAKSLNGLMGKVVKGRYEPLPKVYSKNLSRLVDRMLSLDPNARPSLQDILALPFIKRHIHRFLTGIAERPTRLIGDGTMVLRKAALGVGGFGGDRMLQKQTVNLKKQLQNLGMQDVVQGAFNSPVSPPAPPQVVKSPTRVIRSTKPSMENAGNHFNRNAAQPHRQRRELRKAAKEQRNALLIERERKRAVENALAKLRKERALRAQERNMRLQKQREREQNARRRQQEIRMRNEEKRRALVEERKAAQKRASERIRQYNSKHKTPMMRWKNSNPKIVAQRKAKQFEKEYSKETVMNQKDRVIHEREERKRIAENAQRDLLMKAAQERMTELDRANEMHLNQFHPKRIESRKSCWGPPKEVVEGDEDREDVELSESEDETDGDEKVEEEDNAYESDHSSVPEAMKIADSDDDIDNMEEELKAELEVATMRCSTIKKTLREFKAELKKPQHENKTEKKQHVAATTSSSDEESDESDDSDEEIVPVERVKRSAVQVRLPKKCVAPPPPRIVEEEEEEDDSSDESSSDDDLFSPVLNGDSDNVGFISAKRGGLQSRIKSLEDECIRVLGRKRFDQVYGVLKSNLDDKLYENGDNRRSDAKVQAKLNALLAGDGKLTYASKIDNIIFMRQATM